MADTLTNSELARKLSDYIDSDKFGKTYFANWTSANATTFVDLPTAPGVTAPQPSLAMILSGVTGPAANAVAAVAAVQLVANSVTGQVSIATAKAAAASVSANAAAISAQTAGSYSDVAGTRADQARVYMELARDQANASTVANTVISNGVASVTANTALILTLKTSIDATANSIALTNAAVLTVKGQVDAANTSVWTAKGLIDTANTNVTANKTAAATSATSAGTANTGAWTAKAGADASAANAVTANTGAWSAKVGADAVLTSVNAANTTVTANKNAAANAVIAANAYAAQAAVYASAINPANYVTIASLTWANTTGKPSLFPTDISNVSGLSTALAAKLDTTSFTYSALPGKPNSFPTDMANVAGLQPVLDNKLTAYPGIAGSFAAFQINSFGFDSAQGDGLGNIVVGGVHAKTANASATGYNFTSTGRGASRYGGHDSTINTYVANTTSGVAGQSIGWIQTMSMSATAANFLVQPQFNGANVATTTDLATGLATKQATLGYTPANLTGAAFTGNVSSTGQITAPTIAAGTAGSMAGGGIAIDVSGNNLRIYERGGTFRGVAVDLTGAGAQSALWHSGNFTPSTKLDTTAFTYAGLSGKPTYFPTDTTNVSGLTAALALKANLASPQFTGAVNMTGVAGATRLFGVQTSGNQRWMWGADAIAEGGSNAGSNFALYSYADNGSFIGTPINVIRATGAINLSGAVSVTGALSATGNVTTTALVVGAAQGVFVSGQNHRLVFDPATGARVTYRGDHATAVGINLQTNAGGQSGAIYSDGNGSNFGFLHPTNGWRFRAYSGGASIYTDGGVENKVWSSGNIPTDAWQTSVDGKGRFWFATNSDTIYKTNALHAWRNASDTTVMTLTSAGQLAINANVRSSDTGGTGQFTAVSGSTMAGFYNDGTTFYVLKSSTSSTTFDGHRPLYVSLATGSVNIDGTGAGGTQIGGALGVTGTVTCGSEIVTPGWIRLSGNQGVYFSAWGGGWNMTDSSWMRSYGDKGIYTGGQVLAGSVSASVITGTSDRKFKTAIRDLEPVAGLVPRRFVKGRKESLGYIAQEVQAVAPEAVHTMQDMRGDDYLSLDPLAMIAAVHAQLEARIVALEAR